MVLIGSIVAAEGVAAAQIQETQAAGTPEAQLQEVVITAEKIRSTAQRIPATIEVVNADTLQRQQIVEFTDLNSILSDTQIVPVVGGTQVFIRGLGSVFIDPRADPVVATSLNGLFF